MLLSHQRPSRLRTVTRNAPALPACFSPRAHSTAVVYRGLGDALRAQARTGIMVDMPFMSRPSPKAQILALPKFSTQTLLIASVSLAVLLVASQ